MLDHKLIKAREIPVVHLTTAIFPIPLINSIRGKLSVLRADNENRLGRITDDIGLATFMAELGLPAE